MALSPDISGIIKGTGLALEQQALNQFGAAVGSLGTTALRDIFKLPSETQQPDPIAGQPGIWHPTRYAGALVKPDQVDFNPKLKFLFKISFEFDPEIIAAAPYYGLGDLRRLQENITFTVTRIDRPKWDFEYEEVNMYNYRTKVLKQIKHREVGFTLYDDVGNSVLDFINVYRKLLMPIARTETNSNNLNPENFGMEFKTAGGEYNSLDTSMRSALPGNAVNILKKMTIHQIFVERGSQVAYPSAWTRMVNFEFMRPRFTSIDIDDMDHENGGNYSLINFTADFDTLFMTHQQSYSAEKTNSLPSGDIPGEGSSAISAAGGQSNPFLDIIANQTGRAVQQSVSNIINKTFGTGAGGLIAGQLTGIGGALGEAAKRTLNGVSLGGFQGGAAPSTPYIKDSSVPSSRSVELSNQTSSIIDI